ncbi:hypothetical protein BCR36DRAFT_585730 [Piromyces finnis]|uniref:Uncharacterized protein n=1 Tax=Piromyces finnis TaxID=1754191 RepID=A0A1Y1V425_9FUNG|nr:hypothetical protein BCR36DRAFT_585730 [Piromyces finnis]|eukprot:ORX45417.1 hypothetical protein BCR36DRAFT_585730 [Piromyces finnis]
MARMGSSMGNSRTQRINQSKFGDITVRYGKDKRSNVNKKMPSTFKTRDFQQNKLSKKSFTGSSTLHKSHANKETYNTNHSYRITLSRFIKMSTFVVLILLSVWIYTTGDDTTVVRHRRSVSDVISQLSNKYIDGGYASGQSAAAWSRYRRSKGAYGDDMSNPHNGVSDDDSIVQKVLADFAKLVKSESENYVSGNKINNANDDNTTNNNSNNNDL